MFENHKNIKIAVTAIILCVVVVVAALIVRNVQGISVNRTRVDVYFLEPASNALAPEAHYVDRGENSAMADGVFKILYGGPKSKNLARTFPENVRWLGGNLVENDAKDGMLLEVVFSSEYMDMSPAEEQFFRASLVWSMTELPFIKDVLIYVDDLELLKTGGQPMGRLNRNNVRINPAISPTKVNTRQVKLYFYDEENQKLSPETRMVRVDPDQPIEKYIVEQLIAGPKTSAFSATVPAETKIRGDVKTEDDICYVNFSGDFTTKTTATGDILRLNIYSIVNSLTELENVKKVQILIEAEKIENFKGSIDLGAPLGRDEDVILE